MKNENCRYQEVRRVYGMKDFMNMAGEHKEYTIHKTQIVIYSVSLRGFKLLRRFPQGKVYPPNKEMK